jgi:protease-4
VNRNRWALLAIGLLVMGSLVLSVVLVQDWPALNRGNIGVITLTGGIAEGPADVFGGSAITPAAVRQLLAAVEADSQVAAVVLRIESPGGSVAASQEIGALIRDFPLPVVVSMADLVASGGLYISVFADRIVAQPGTITGSIGVIMSHIYLGELYERLGIQAEVLTAGEHKGIGMEPLTQESRQLLQEFLDDLHRQFIQAVAEGRQLDPEKVRDMATGEIFTGLQAKTLGLVDRLGGLELAIEEAAALAGVDHPEPVDITLPDVPWWETLNDFPSLLLDRVSVALLGKDALLLRQQLQRHLLPTW